MYAQGNCTYNKSNNSFAFSGAGGWAVVPLYPWDNFVLRCGACNYGTWTTTWGDSNVNFTVVVSPSSATLKKGGTTLASAPIAPSLPSHGTMTLACKSSNVTVTHNGSQRLLTYAFSNPYYRKEFEDYANFRITCSSGGTVSNVDLQNIYTIEPPLYVANDLRATDIYARSYTEDGAPLAAKYATIVALSNNVNNIVSLSNSFVSYSNISNSNIVSLSNNVTSRIVSLSNSFVSYSNISSSNIVSLSNNVTSRIVSLSNSFVSYSNISNSNTISLSNNVTSPTNVFGVYKGFKTM